MTDIAELLEKDWRLFNKRRVKKTFCLKEEENGLDTEMKSPFKIEREKKQIERVYWTIEENETFVEGLRIFGKNWHEIKRYLDGKRGIP